jgi:hypothetical protein
MVNVVWWSIFCLKWGPYKIHKQQNTALQIIRITGIYNYRHALRNWYYCNIFETFQSFSSASFAIFATTFTSILFLVRSLVLHKNSWDQ